MAKRRAKTIRWNADEKRLVAEQALALYAPGVSLSQLAQAAQSKLPKPRRRPNSWPLTQFVKKMLPADAAFGRKRVEQPAARPDDRSVILEGMERGLIPLDAIPPPMPRRRRTPRTIEARAMTGASGSSDARLAFAHDLVRWLLREEKQS